MTEIVFKCFECGREWGYGEGDDVLVVYTVCYSCQIEWIKRHMAVELPAGVVSRGRDANSKEA